ncbi:MAG: SIMPL domain-containing protein, partial [Chloroflexi bacterium]|nr:SIMPL domain-containing protein [Chloroflexota bacterium]
SDLRKYRDQARELAVIAASEKAQDLASAAGAEAGCVLSISENTWSYFSGGYWGRNNNLWTQNTVQNVPSGNSSGDSSEFGPVNLGQISVRAEVNASYALQ